MKIVSIGGGPAGLYFSILMKQQQPDAEIVIYERNKPDDTFGWGVVFSDETLGNFLAADAETYERIRESFIYWSDIDTHYRDTCVRSTGHGFCGMARKRLLQILHERCADLDIDIHFETDVEDVEAHQREADLLLGCDGLNSRVRDRWADAFKPDIRMGSTHFSWLGCDKQLDAFTFIFRENEHGLWRVHAYPFAAGLSTFIVEGSREAWLAAGMEHADESDTVAYCTELFADHLGDAKLLTNRSIWRQFPTVRNERWHHDNVVLMGDAAHTAHFSIGSGTKLAMEDAIALAEAFEHHGDADIPKVLETYQDARWLDALKIQRVARTSRTWFEETERYTHQHPLQFNFSLMSRSKQITWDNLSVRDPELMDQVREWWWDAEATAPRATDGSAPPPMFAPLKLRDLELANRVVVSPMCQYSAEGGVVNDWHLMHLGSRAVGGAGLVITEMTDVSPEGRITEGCAGLWNDEQTAAWKRIVDFVHEHSAAALGCQLAHAGRKASCHLPWEGDDPLTDDSRWETVGPSALPFDTGWPTPKAMDRVDMDKVRDDFVAATRRADVAGFDLIEMHMAHGYLLSSFLSPASNRRDDEYGGSLENRLRFPLEVFQAVRAAWPEHKPLAVRVSASDWFEREDPDKGQTLDDTVEIVRVLREHGLDLIDVSSAGNTPESKPDYGRMYQVPFAERIRQEVDVPVMAVGAILGQDHCNTILAAGRADLCALARPHLVNPHLTLGAAVAYEFQDQVWPRQYLPAKPRPRR